MRLKIAAVVFVQVITIRFGSSIHCQLLFFWPPESVLLWPGKAMADTSTVEEIQIRPDRTSEDGDDDDDDDDDIYIMMKCVSVCL